MASGAIVPAQQETVEKTPLERASIAIAEEAKQLKVTDEPSYLIVTEQLKMVATTIKNLESFFAPMKSAAHKAWRSICDRENETKSHLEVAKNHLSRQVTEWNTKKERERQETERKLREEALKKQEDEKLAEASVLEQQGRHEEAAEVISEPIHAPTIVVAKDVPKVAGISTRQTWNFRITNESLIPREYLVVDEGKIRKVVKAMQQDTKIPGVEVYTEDSVVTRTK